MPSSSLDVVVIGAGHNGLTCACYLAAAGLKVRVVERRPVVGGAAVTEEFFPGFRNSTASYTVSLLNPKVIRDLRLAEHGLRIVERPFSNFVPLPDGRSLRFGGDLADNTGGSLEVLAARCRALARVLRTARPARRPAEAMGAAHAAESRRTLRHRGLARSRRRRAVAAADGPAAARRAARPGRRLHEERRRLARPLVRVGTAESGARLGFGGRQLRQPVRGRVGLRAAASLLRRSERQARQVGPCDRRHGGHHAGDGGGSARARRRGHDGGSGAARGRRARRGGRRRTRLRRGRPRAGGGGERQPEAAVPATAGRQRVAARVQRSDAAVQVRLGHVPDECRAARTARLLGPARQRRRSLTTRAASCSRRRSPTWTRPGTARSRRGSRPGRSSRC